MKRTQTVNKYDVFADDRRNMHTIYEQMRAEHPICPVTAPHGNNTFWFFTRYDDCVRVLKEPRFGKQLDKHLPPNQRHQPNPDDPFEVINYHLLNIDPPDHTRLRNLVHKAFTPRMIQDLQPRIQQIADDLLDNMESKDSGDLLADFGFPLPITVIAEMLGVSADDREDFKRWSQILLFSADMSENHQALFEFATYMNHLIDERTAEPQDDLISGLVEAHDADDRFTREELLSMIFLLLVAGHETTVNLIGNGMLALMQHLDQKQMLIDDPGLIKTAVEEMLRYDGPVECPTFRWALEDVQMDGYHIQLGDVILPSLIGANRDPAQFPSPNEFDINRRPNKHIAFGYGIHHCLGAPLARLEGTIAINALLKRFPDVQLSVSPDKLQWNASLLIRGMKTLPVDYCLE